MRFTSARLTMIRTMLFGFMCIGLNHIQPFMPEGWGFWGNVAAGMIGMLGWEALEYTWRKAGQA